MMILGIETHSGPLHAVLAIAMMALAAAIGIVAGAPPAQALWTGWGVAIGHFWGREQRDQENKLHRAGHVQWPWQWEVKMRWDAGVPLAVCTLAAAGGDMLLWALS